MGLRAVPWRCEGLSLGFIIEWTAGCAPLLGWCNNLWGGTIDISCFSPNSLPLFPKSNLSVLSKYIFIMLVDLIFWLDLSRFISQYSIVRKISLYHLFIYLVINHLLIVNMASYFIHWVITYYGPCLFWCLNCLWLAQCESLGAGSMCPFDMSSVFKNFYRCNLFLAVLYFLAQNVQVHFVPPQPQPYNLCHFSRNSWILSIESGISG